MKNPQQQQGDTLAAALVDGFGRVLDHIETEAAMPGLAERVRPLVEEGVGTLPELGVRLALPRTALIGLELLRMAHDRNRRQGGPSTWAEHFAAQQNEQEAAA